MENRSVTTMARTEHTFLSSNHHFQSNLSACFVAVGAAILSLTVRHTFWISIVHNQYQYQRILDVRLFIFSVHFF